MSRKLRIGITLFFLAVSVPITLWAFLIISRPAANLLYSDQRKLWAHATNSIDKAVERSSNFQGIEIDVVFSTLR